MIKEATFPQPWIEEPEDPIYEINPCTTSFIKDLPQGQTRFMHRKSVRTL
jgi:hypothetical protein